MYNQLGIASFLHYSVEVRAPHVYSKQHAHFCQQIINAYMQSAECRSMNSSKECMGVNVVGRALNHVNPLHSQDSHSVIILLPMYNE